MWATSVKYRKQRTGFMTSWLRTQTSRASFLLASLRIIILALAYSLISFTTSWLLRTLTASARSESLPRHSFRSEPFVRERPTRIPSSSINVSMTCCRFRLLNSPATFTFLHDARGLSIGRSMTQPTLGITTSEDFIEFG